jgi:molecular chaperone DnaK
MIRGHMPIIIGVDLGTTNTAVAVLENGRPRVIEDERGYKVLPSVVSAKGEGRFVVGQAAHNLILTRPERTVYAAKRLIGRRFDSPEVQRVLPRVGFALREGPDGGVQLEVGDAWMSPQEVAAIVLQVARGIAEKALGEPVEEAVITVPAHFNHAQRKATLEAASIAGLRCERLLNEPTAAALAYGHRRNIDRTLAIFDLGGGTFDVSVLRLSNGIYEILSTNGDTFLGGEDFDYRVVDHLADTFKASNGIDLRRDRAALQRLKDAGERAKCELSFSDRASVVVPHAAPGQNLETTLTRVQLEQITNDLVERCIDIARDAVVEAGLTISDIDEIILVGGQTRMPRVREAVAGLFGREPSRSVHPEEAVAIGAAVHAASLGDVEGPPAVLLDITPFDLGIDAAGGLFSRIVPRNARVPCSEARIFATASDDQTSVRITVRQGESRIAEENEFLGEFLFEGLTPAPRMQTKVAVTFRIDPNGMLHVSALEPGTGVKRNIAIRNYAERTRTVVAPTGATASPAGGAPPAEVAKSTKKKAGFFDSLFGSKSGKGNKKADAAAATPPVAPAAATVVGAAAVALQPPPTIAPLPPAAPPPPDDTPDDADGIDGVLSGDELDEVEPDAAMAFEMPADLGEEDLYDPHTAGPASFGLAGATQVGGSGSDPFADLGPAPTARGYGSHAAPPPSAHAALSAEDLFGEVGDADYPDESRDGGDPFTAVPLETLSPVPLPTPERAAPPPPAGPTPVELDMDLGGLDAADLFASALADRDTDDPPTDPNLRFPVFNATLAPLDDPPAEAPRLEGGLHFERLVEPAVDDLGFGVDEPGAATDDDGLGFVFADPEPAPEQDGDPDAAGEIGFSFLDPMPDAGFSESVEDEPSVAAVPARRSAAGADRFGFALASPEAPPESSSDEHAARSTALLPHPTSVARRDAEATEVFTRPAPLDEDAEFVFPMPDDEPAAPVKKRKPARVKLTYRDREELVSEYRANLSRGGAVIRTEKPLATGRECVFEISGPGIPEALLIPARVVRIVPDGMEVAYALEPVERDALLAVLTR